MWSAISTYIVYQQNQSLLFSKTYIGLFSKTSHDVMSNVNLHWTVQQNQSWCDEQCQLTLDCSAKPVMMWWAMSTYIGLFSKTSHDDHDVISDVATGLQWHGQTTDGSSALCHCCVGQRANQQPRHQADVADAINELFGAAKHTPKRCTSGKLSGAAKLKTFMYLSQFAKATQLVQCIFHGWCCCFFSALTKYYTMER